MEGCLNLLNAFAQNTTELEKIRQSIINFSRQFGNYKMSKGILHNSKINYDVPGQNGTLLKAYQEVPESFTCFQNSFNKLSKSIQSSVINILDQCISNRKLFYCSMSSTFKSKEKEVIVAKSQLAQTHKELISLANLLNAASTKPNNASTKKEITNLYARYTKSTSTFEQRKQKLFQALAAITAFSDECNRRLKELNDSSNSELFNTYRQLKDVVINMINEIKDKSCILVKIDFMTDFTEFINKHHICFIDVSPVRFDKFVFSNRFIAPESSLIPRFKMEYFPFFLCTVLHDFTSSEDNELSVSKDMRLFLMEKPKCEWALVMKPKYAECGFVPFSFINVIGYGVAVVAEPGSDVFDVGTIVAIMEEENGQIMCEDVYGNSALLPKSQLIVLEVP